MAKGYHRPEEISATIFRVEHGASGFFQNFFSLFTKLHGIIRQMTAPLTMNPVRTSNLTKYHSISATPIILHTTLYKPGILTRVTRHFILKANI
jgi:hypothetical protein